MNLALKEFYLDNGLTVVYKQIPSTGVVSVQAWVHTGSVNESSINNGISHFLEHIVFKGSTNFKPGEIDIAVESCGGSLNAATSRDYTMYYVTSPSKHVDTSFNAVSDMVFYASFIPSEIDAEKPVVVQEIKMEFDNPTHKMWREVIRNGFKDTPYSRDIIGTEDNVNSFTADMLRDYYEGYYHPQNMVLVVAGDISLEEVKKLSKKYFSVKRNKGPKELYTKIDRRIFEKFDKKSFEADVSLEYLALVYKADSLTENSYLYRVLSDILSGGDYSVLNKELKYDNRVVTSIGAREFLNKYSGSFILDITTDIGGGDKAATETIKVLDSVKSGNIELKHLEKAKNRVNSGVLFKKERASRLAGELGYYYTLGLKEYYTRYVELVNKVSLNDIVEFANNLFKTEYLEYRTVPKINA